MESKSTVSTVRKQMVIANFYLETERGKLKIFLKISANLEIHTQQKYLSETKAKILTQT